MNKLTIIVIFLFLVSRAFGGDVFEDRIERAIPLRADGTFSLRSIDGSVEIYGAENDEVKVLAIRKAFSLKRLNAIQMNVMSHGDAVHINTTAAPVPRWGLRDRSGTVNYIINLPQRARISAVEVPTGELLVRGMRGGAINATVVNGRLTSYDCYCDQTLRVQRGALHFYFNWNDLRPIGVNGTIENGNIWAVIPKDSSFKLDAASRYGRVASEFTAIEERRRGGVSEINETIGAVPFSSLILRATHGNISITQTPW